MITWIDLGLALVALLGAALIALGLLAIFAAGMAARPDDGTSKQGCNTALFGLVLLALAIWGFVR